MSPGPAIETILCDTSFVGVQERGLAQPASIAHWPAPIVGRLNAAILALPVFALAEIRAGRMYANWGKPRSDAQEARLAAFLQIPLDDEILDRYAELHAWMLTSGTPLPHNDLWIAATSLARGIPLVSCDSDFDKVAEAHPLEHIFLPPKP